MRHFILSILFVSVLNAQGFIIHYDSPAEGEEAPACEAVEWTGGNTFASTSQNPSWAYEFGSDDSYAIIGASFYASSAVTATSVTVDGNAATQIRYKSQFDGTNYWITIGFYCAVSGGGNKTVTINLSGSVSGGVYTCLGFECGGAISGASDDAGQSTSTFVTVTSSVTSQIVYICTWNGNIDGYGTAPSSELYNIKDPSSGCATHVSIRTGSASEDMEGSLPYDEGCNGDEGCDPFFSAIGFSVDLPQ